MVVLLAPQMLINIFGIRLTARLNDFSVYWHIGGVMLIAALCAPAAALSAEPGAGIAGTWVTYDDEQGNERCYQLVGPDEFDVSIGRISVDSPVGQALLQFRIERQAAEYQR